MFEEASSHQIKRMVSTHAADNMLQLHLVPSKPTPQPIPTSIFWLKPLLEAYTHLFSKPKHLPPTCPTDHSIPLLSGTDPVNVRPYHYPHFRKNETEAQIKDMLSQWIIQPSSSAFFSPVLLVKKMVLGNSVLIIELSAPSQSRTIFLFP